MQLHLQIPFLTYPADFRTDKGTAYNARLRNGDAPVAQFSRLRVGDYDIDSKENSTLVSGSKFEFKGDSLAMNGYFDSPDVQLITRNIYDKDSKKNILIVTAKALKAIVGQHTLIVEIIEDNIISDQKWYGAPGGNHVKNYTHRHMFRDAIGALDGNAFIESGLKIGENFSKTFRYTLDESWNAKKLHFRDCSP